MSQDAPKNAYQRLSTKQRQFVDQLILHHFNGAAAARACGYTQNENARQQAWRMSTNVDIKEGLRARLDELALSKEELRARLEARVDVDLVDFLDDEGAPQWSKAVEAGKTHLVKKFKVSTRVLREVKLQEETSSTTLTTEKTTIEIELVDPIRALELLGRASGLSPALELQQLQLQLAKEELLQLRLRNALLEAEAKGKGLSLDPPPYDPQPGE